MIHFSTYEQFINESNAGGDCYQAAGNLSMSGNSDYILVHGMVNGQGNLTGVRYGHAWIEHKNNVLDHSNGRTIIMPKPVYYKAGGIDKKDNIYYTVEEARKWILKTEHWGPWEMSGDPIMLGESIPKNRDEIGTLEIPVNRKDLKKIKSLNI